MNKKRDYGIELFRIVSMYMIVLLHIAGFSGLADLSNTDSKHYLLCNVIRGFTYCGVNCFALISGYVGIYSNFKMSRIVSNWIRVLWFSITIQIILCLFFELEVYWWLTSVLPVSMEAYWYFTQYFRMFFLIPFMNYFVKKTPKKIGLVVFLVALTYIFFNQESIDKGYHFAWLALLYMCGAFIRYHKLFLKCNIKRPLFVYLLCSLLTIFSIVMYDVHIYTFSLMEYTSPTVFLSGVSLLLVFMKLKLNFSKELFVGKISTLVFSVYLFHTHPIFFMKVLTGCLEKFSECNTFVAIGLILVLSFFLYLFGCFLEKIRIKIFERLHLKEKLVLVDNAINDMVAKSKICRTFRLNKYFLGNTAYEECD